MSALPPIDMHAHVDVRIGDDDLERIGAVVFAVTRSLSEASTAQARTSSPRVVWGVGVHPGLVEAHVEFDQDVFARAVDDSCFVGEVGLDGASPVRKSIQDQTLRAILEVLASKPRVVSLHSAGATTDVLNHLEDAALAGAVLHWWLGSASETARAVELGCYFSINHEGLGRTATLRAIPIDRLLTETDHPYGDRNTKDAQPGRVDPVEAALATAYRTTQSSVRRQIWQNLRALAAETSTGGLFPLPIRAYLAALPTEQSIRPHNERTNQLRFPGAEHD